MEENPLFRTLPRTGDAVFETLCREGYVSDGAAHAAALLRGRCNNGIFYSGRAAELVGRSWQAEAPAPTYPSSMARTRMARSRPSVASGDNAPSDQKRIASGR